MAGRWWWAAAGTLLMGTAFLQVFTQFTIWPTGSEVLRTESGGAVTFVGNFWGGPFLPVFGCLAGGAAAFCIALRRPWGAVAIAAIFGLGSHAASRLAGDARVVLRPDGFEHRFMGDELAYKFADLDLVRIHRVPVQDSLGHERLSGRIEIDFADGARSEATTDFVFSKAWPELKQAFARHGVALAIEPGAEPAP